MIIWHKVKIRYAQKQYLKPCRIKSYKQYSKCDDDAADKINNQRKKKKKTRPVCKNAKLS